MKKIMVALTASALLVGGSAYAQQGSTGQRSMIEFNADSLLNGVLSFSKSKSKDQNADNSMDLDLRLNYAYQLPQFDKLQLGGGVNYKSGTESGRGDIEDYGFNVAAYLNNTSDLQNAYYASVKWGLEWANTLSGGGRDEVGTIQLAVGKRVDLSYFGIRHLTYTPEIAFVNQDSTTGGALEYSQNLEFRFLQFSVFY
ncbi:hypothetical protein [Peredibacter starrii]|uniref:Outer membrane protein beta-barrel domain-containing protein n=1 Tax=Peredibacter starrii TaxID=28202 RepID=A0AAX4HSS9_9BACT|nr:hypothetical protein [Peredibacter starrii]WPU66266.1 hypothetical protein SOO65_05855 [Peredibacter starrii]